MRTHLLQPLPGCRVARRVASMKQGPFEALRAQPLPLRDRTQLHLLQLVDLCWPEARHV